MPWLIVIVAVFLAGAGMRLFAAGESSGRAAMQQQLDAADAKLASKAQALEQESANHITDMEAAYESGESNAKTIYVTRSARAVSDIAANPVFRNLACVLPADVVHVINDARASVRNAADSGGAAAAVPAAAPAAVGQPGGPVPADAGGRRPLGKVHPQG